ncbi:BSD domain protein [Senna tora]|uniref:BSD domain protein n=1 Tax=Senna tora TaxID=362788 RepID=A0A834WQ55_9FABA|nr:BSD domain protein [Senna tora]
MSWLARSLANSLRLDDDVPNRPRDLPTTSPKNHEYPHLQHHHPHQPHQPQDDELELDHEAQARGVREDLNEFKQTLTRQFWGMASFLAPPPTNSHQSPPSEHHCRSDLATFAENQSEPSDQCVSGNGEEESVENEESDTEECDLNRAVGITEEVLTFARNIAMHPETWLDFPIDEEEDTDDLDMSDAQLVHALVIERLAPRLAALRIELCPCHMSEGYFWKVYFVLLHSRLNKQDAEVLSTPQVMAARAMWMQELQKQMKPESEWFERSTSYMRDTAQHEDFASRILDYAMAHGTHGCEPTTWPAIADYETEKHTIESSETIFIDKTVIEEETILKTEDKDLGIVRSSKIVLPDYEDDEDEWPEEDSELGVTTMPVVNEDDISFSDLEDDDYGIKPVKPVTESKTV